MVGNIPGLRSDYGDNGLLLMRHARALVESKYDAESSSAKLVVPYFMRLESYWLLLTSVIRFSRKCDILRHIDWPTTVANRIRRSRRLERE